MSVDYRIDNQMQSVPAYESSDTKVWGFVWEGLELLLNEEWSVGVLNSISGYFFAIRNRDHKIQMANDFLAGYRVYFVKTKNVITISEDYCVLMDIMKEQVRHIEGDQEEIAYWKKHRYTLNKGTLIRNLKKFSPATLVTIDGERVAESTYYKNVSRKTDSRKLLENNFEIVKRELIALYESNVNKTFILFYSGGVDSTLLLLLCKELKIPVKCLLIRYQPMWSVNIQDIAFAQKNLERYGMDNDIIDVDLYDAYKRFGKNAMSDMLFDRHLAVHFYETYRTVSERYGDDVVIINGQSADSILSFGPSLFTKGNMIKRMILAFSQGPISIIGKAICRIINSSYDMPSGKDEACYAMLDDTNYLFLTDRKCQYNDMLKREVNEMYSLGIDSYEGMRMYCKMIGFLQGSDNQVVIRAANKSGIHSVCMPFTCPEFIYNVIRYKNNLYEIINPKYFIRDTLKHRYGYKNKANRVIPSNRPDFDMDSFAEKIDLEYFRTLDRLLET